MLLCPFIQLQEPHKLEVFESVVLMAAASSINSPRAHTIILISSFSFYLELFLGSVHILPSCCKLCHYYRAEKLLHYLEKEKWNQEC